MNRTLDLYEIALPHDKLAKAPRQESAFYLQTMTILHDINALQRAIVISGPKQGENIIGGPIVSGQVVQSFTFIKSLAGVLCEAYDCIQFGYYADNRLPLKCKEFKKYKKRKKLIKKNKMINLDSVYRAHFSSNVKNAQDEMEKYFSKRNLLRNLRNKYAFHYDFQEAIKNYNKFNDLDDPHMLLSDVSANCCYVSAHQWLILRALRVEVDTEELGAKFDALMEEAVKQARNMANFFHGFIKAFSVKYIDLDKKKAKEINLDNVMFIDEIRFPFFSNRRR